jgi:hypothetical protein
VDAASSRRFLWRLSDDTSGIEAVRGPDRS